ncbi:hypothetical protein GCM10022225_75650 [Plantactinospora mayteni]|uniref:Vitamin K epoxide reductase domain-containing protein n=1 Tax=Plantactinospora mayteni TaxID=566021 RepID=A0ABQ4F267_9ACTN|nr:hypothetical protein [Plantactinospora mayteni]GIH00940.1 hypothetical protein Pma05_75120 [Plantactinospora mayteni]
MDDVAAPRRASFGLSLLVALGWYTTVLAAVFVGHAGIPATPNRDCAAVFSCMTPQEELGLLVILGGPILAGLLFSTLVVTGLLARRVPSSILTGTLSALGSVVVVAVAGAVWQGLR